jgi:hypothetical protein
MCARSSGFVGYRASASTTTSVRSSPAATASRSSGIRASRTLRPLWLPRAFVHAGDSARKGLGRSGRALPQEGLWPARRFAELNEQYSDWRERTCNRRTHATGRFPVQEPLAEERQRCERCRRCASTGPGTVRRLCRSTATCVTTAASTARQSGSCTSELSCASIARPLGLPRISLATPELADYAELWA